MHRTWKAFAVVSLAMAGCVAGPLPPAGGHGPAARPPTPWPGGSPWGVVRCESLSVGARHCAMDTRSGVRLVRQLSAAACEQGRSWGWDSRGVWVSRGCRAEFESGRGWPGSGAFPPTGPNVVRCESRDGRMQRCRIDARNGVRLVRQLSGVRCVQGRNWGWDSRGVWVSQGCRAEFAAGRVGGPWTPAIPGAGPGQMLRCESHDNRRRRCSVRVGSGVDLVRELSDRRCMRGRTWGWDRSGIWVSQGCRAEFRVR